LNDILGDDYMNFPLQVADLFYKRHMQYKPTISNISSAKIPKAIAWHNGTFGTG